MTITTEVDWRRLKTEFEKIISTVEPFEIISEEEFEDLKLNVRTYQPPNLIQRKLEHGFCLLAPAANGTHRHQRLKTLAREMGYPDRSKPMSKVASSLIARNPTAISTIKEALENRSMSTELVMAWGRLKEFISIYSIEMAGPDLIEASLAGIKAQSTDVQAYWYAHWIKENAGSFNVKDRRMASEEFADVCQSISLDRLLPSSRYPKDWFSRLIDNDGALKGNIAKIGLPKLKQLVSDPRVSPNVLPPLKKEKFLKNRCATPQGVASSRV